LSTGSDIMIKADILFSKLFNLRSCTLMLLLSEKKEKSPPFSLPEKIRVFAFISFMRISSLCLRALAVDGSGYLATSLVGLPLIYTLTGVGTPLLVIRILYLTSSVLEEFVFAYKQVSLPKEPQPVQVE
jgi:hypothetical protein